MPQSQIIELPFPFSGINETEAKRRQPKGTTPDCLNVRPFDPIAGDRRGGQRGGIDKYVAAQINGVNSIQVIDQLDTALDSTLLVADQLLMSEPFTYDDGSLETVSAARWKGFRGTSATSMQTLYALFGAVEDGTNYPAVSLNTMVSSLNGNTSVNAVTALYNQGLSLGPTYEIQGNVTLQGDTADCYCAVVLRANPDPVTNHQYYVIGFLHDDSGAGSFYMDVWDISASTVRIRIGAQVNLGAGHVETTFAIRVAVNGNQLTIYVDTVQEFQEPIPNYTSQTKVGLSIGRDSAGGVAIWDDVAFYTATAPATIRNTALISVAGGGIYAGTRDSMSLATNGANRLRSEGSVTSQASQQKMYFCDGIPRDYVLYTRTTGAITNWFQAVTDGTMPVGTTQTALNITGVSTGAETFTVVEDLSATITAGDVLLVAGSTGNDGFWTVNSVAGGGTVITVNEDVTDATVNGTITFYDVGCKDMTLYRGRTVMWGMPSDPQNWFMSAVNNPLNFDYSPATTSQTQAVAGNNSDAGLLGDILNCCAPYSDDLMFMGGDHTLWVMRGDPAAGGVIDNISYQTGIVGPDAFAWDPEGNFYFLGSEKLWRIPAGSSAPEPMSRGRLDSTFSSLNLKTSTVHMIWDIIEQGLHVFIVPSAQAASGSEPTHIFWDTRTDSFWKDKYPSAMGPTTVYVFDADDPDDTAVLLGGWDGYIRFIDINKADDDGTAIASHVWYRPILLSDMSRVRISEIRAIMATGSGAVRLEVHASDTAENLIASATPRFTHDLAADRNRTIIKRAVGNAIGVKLVNDSAALITWAVESMTARVTPAGRHRQGVL